MEPLPYAQPANDERGPLIRTMRNPHAPIAPRQAPRFLAVHVVHPVERTVIEGYNHRAEEVDCCLHTAGRVEDAW